MIVKLTRDLNAQLSNVKDLPIIGKDSVVLTAWVEPEVYSETSQPSMKRISAANPLTLKDPFISENCTEIKIELNFYFQTSLWCLKRSVKIKI